MHESRPVTHKTCSLNAKLFLGIEKRPIFDQMLLVFEKKKRNGEDTNDPVYQRLIFNKNFSDLFSLLYC